MAYTPGVNDAPGVKVCTRCGLSYVASVEFFTPSNDNLSGLRPECRTCYRRLRSVKYVEPVMEGVKTCLGCEREKCVTEFFVKRTTGDGRAAQCKECQKAAKRRNAALPREDVPDTRKCYRCFRKLPLTTEYFYRNNHNPYGLDYECRECSRARGKRWSEENPEKNLERSRRWRKNNPGKHAQYHREWQQQNREYVRKKLREWGARNPDKVRANRKAMRAKRRAAYGSHTAQDILDRYKAQGGMCMYCFKEIPFGEAHADHFIPLARGGRNDAWNIVVACAPCNMSKGKKLIGEWRGL